MIPSSEFFTAGRYFHLARPNSEMIRKFQFQFVCLLNTNSVGSALISPVALGDQRANKRSESNLKVGRY